MMTWNAGKRGRLWIPGRFGGLVFSDRQYCVHGVYNTARLLGRAAPPLRNVNDDCISRELEPRTTYAARPSAADVGCCLARAAWMLQRASSWE
ncbi:hypothetical protein Y032_1137g3671 [Ancylostoma ceylanicum]|uniref:Uncharacterized protein n=1 Tax=Ancylostoma ceylanicum TaxID=53326 RepID=A0A016W791_9BILA|nr:hypothetical protein Y032_1137g3671 [Ancylostoma ceylanicum]